MTSATNSPPPSIHNLDAAQRARVMRSSRKVGAVLGTTPFLLESCGGTVLVPTTLHHSTRRDTHVKRRHRHREGASSSISETSPLISLSAISSSSDESPLHKFDTSTEELLAPRVSTSSQRDCTPRPLVLRLDTVLLSSSDPHTPTVPLSPLSPNTDDVPPTPVTPLELSRAESRRRKMARVVRTLGENVPPELVFQPSSSDDTNLLEKRFPLPSPVPHEARSGPSRTRPSVKLTRPRSRSVGGPTSRWQRLVDLPAPVFSSSTRAPADQHWVGVWNRKNIGQVQRELRALR
jgi:hypothetical protein